MNRSNVDASIIPMMFELRFTFRFDTCVRDCHSKFEICFLRTALGSYFPRLVGWLERPKSCKTGGSWFRNVSMETRDRQKLAGTSLLRAECVSDFPVLVPLKNQSGCLTPCRDTECFRPEADTLP
ncbi:hypothetical protein RRG08_045776 [Elysia crispata]|uniref:Uncharacterized protein n=1 Tax=Elysia crispata TaxID=231223 RepID=A0AAE1E721_9GAST|nr:hypothetical protein RRG08_045776 [Elysia crispata]